MKLTPKQEKFAQVYVECGNASEAYRQAYNAEKMKANSIRVAACRVLGKTNVSLMVEELRAENKKRHEVTTDSMTAMAEKVYNGALEAQQFGAANGAATLMSKLHGLLVDKMDHTIKTFSLEETDGGKNHRKG